MIQRCYHLIRSSDLDSWSPVVQAMEDVYGEYIPSDNNVLFQDVWFDSVWRLPGVFLAYGNPPGHRVKLCALVSITDPGIELWWNLNMPTFPYTTLTEAEWQQIEGTLS